MSDWVDVCDLEEIEHEDVMRWDWAGSTFAIFRSPEGEVFATDGLCTHEQVHLAGGLVMDHLIECPKHNGRFDYRTGAPLRAPVCVALRTYPARVEAGRIQVLLDSAP
jgi:3-phenylpropionate/trans-cinnamate dioxygenase ferredoxin subunit